MRELNRMLTVAVTVFLSATLAACNADSSAGATGSAASPGSTASAGAPEAPATNADTSSGSAPNTAPAATPTQASPSTPTHSEPPRTAGTPVTPPATTSVTPPAAPPVTPPVVTVPVTPPVTTPVTPVATSVSVTGGNAGVVQGANATLVCTTAMSGSHATYNAHNDAELQAVPFDTLAAGDVVNIYAGTTYHTKFGLRAQGTAAAPVIINGVSDSACNKPVLDFAGAVTPATDTVTLGNSVPYRQRLGGIVVMRGYTDDYNTYEPSFITIQGLKVMGARNGASYTTIGGATDAYASSACIWLQSGTDMTIRNNDVSDCGFGIFLMAKDEIISQTTVRVNIANNRVYGNGVSGSYSEHNFYVQAASPVVEGNYIGQVRSGSQGSSYKSRASGEVFRRNYVICSAFCMDFVQSEEQSMGIAVQPNYGTDYVYGNTVISNNGAAIHYGGDNRGEQNSNSVTSVVFVPPVAYRKHLRFWNNTFTLNSADYRDWIFKLSAQETQMDAWGNTLNMNFTGPGQLSFLQYAGQLRLGPQNIINGIQPVDAQTGAGAVAGLYTVTPNSSIPSDPNIATLN